MNRVTNLTDEKRLKVIQKAQTHFWMDAAERWAAFLESRRYDHKPASSWAGVPEGEREAWSAKHRQWTAEAALRVGEALAGYEAARAMEWETYLGRAA